MGYSSEYDIHMQEALYWKSAQYDELVHTDEYYFPMVQPEPKRPGIIGRALIAFKRAIKQQKRPAHEAGLQYEHENIEKDAHFIQRQIERCDNPRYLESLSRMVANLTIIHGDKLQVHGWVDTLNIKIFNKQKELSTN